MHINYMKDETQIVMSKKSQDFPDQDNNTTLQGSELETTLQGSELENFESAQIDVIEPVGEEQLDSVIESLFFASDRPVSLFTIRSIFKGTDVDSHRIRRALERYKVELAGAQRGIQLEEVTGGFQLRTKVENSSFLRRTLKSRPFKLSGPALEVLAIVAYQQPLIKHQIDEIRGVESGHLLRALMEKGLITFEGKSELPGKPMQYGTTKKFLEIFGLRNLRELPTLSQIEELLPEGIGDEEESQASSLGEVSESLSEKIQDSYSENEEELSRITSQIQEIQTTSDFFENEKLKQRQQKDKEKAESLQEAILLGEEISEKDQKWLTRYNRVPEKNDLL